ncbi:MAG: hydrogenase maturation protease [Acidimicrobiales bacterium]
MTGAGPPHVVIAAVGNPLRRDDGAGPAVLEQLRGELGDALVLGALASPLDLLGAWDGAGLAVVVDAVGGDVVPGEVRVVEVDLRDPQGAPTRTAATASSHGLGVSEALRLALALGSMPARVVLVGIGGDDFGEGVGLSPSVSAAVERAAQVVTGLVAEGLAVVR